MGAIREDRTISKRSTIKPTISRLSADNFEGRQTKAAGDGPIQNKTKVVKVRRKKSIKKYVRAVKPYEPPEGWRPPLKMPVVAPFKRKAKHVIAVVGNEIKIVNPKRKRTINSRLWAPKIEPRKIPSYRTSAKGKQKTTVDVEKQISRRFSGKNLEEKSSMKSNRLKMKEEFILKNSTSEENALSGVKGEVMRFGKKRDQTVEKRKKCELYSKNSDSKLSTEKLDPITNVVTTEYVKTLDRCESIYDFVTAPKPTPKPSMYTRVHFHDTTMMEELNFPPINTLEETSEVIPELLLVPPRLPEGLKRSISWPSVADRDGNNAPSNRTSGAFCSGVGVKPKFELIFMSRPMSFPKKKWFYENVASESNSKIKLMYDVIMSQVKKTMKRQATTQYRQQ